MKIKLLFFTFLFLSVVKAQHQSGMTDKKQIFDGFSNNSSVSIENWEKFNSSESKSNPDFGLPLKNAPCTECVEILNKRNENERYFVSINDPSKFYIQKSYGSLNFFKNGFWVAIDENLSKKNDYLYVAENQLDPTGINVLQKNSFIKTPFGTIQFNQWKLYGIKDTLKYEIATANWSDYTIGENGIHINNVFQGIDLELKVNRGTIKSNFIIKKNYFSAFESLIFEDGYASGTNDFLVFKNSESASRGVGELVYKKNNETVLEIGMALIYPQGYEKEKSQFAEYILENNKMGILIPMSWINENLTENNRLIIDPVVTSSNTFAQASITGSGYNATCFNGFCSYNLTVPTPANAVVTDAQWSFNYRAYGICYRSDGAVTFYLGSCRSPSANNLFWFCNTASSGDCLGSNISIFSDISSCLPAPSCTPQNLNFTMRFHRCYSSGGCSNSCVGAISPWTMTITGRTLEYTNATPISLNNSTICQGGSINASTAVSFGVPSYSYNWSLNSNMIPSNGSGSTSTFNFPNSGTYTIYSTVTDACGTVVSSNSSVTVNPTPNITITPNPQTICSGQGTGLTLSSNISNTTYSWTTNMIGSSGATNGSGLGSGANSSLSLNQILSNNGVSPGTSTYTITPSFSGCSGTPSSVIVTVNPVATVVNPGNQTICAGQQTTAITFSGTSGATYTWSNDNTTTGIGASGNGNIAAFTGTNTSNASITSNITVTPTFGTCPGTPVTFTITVAITPTISAVTSQTICAGQQTTATTFSGTATTYNWSNSNTAIGLGASGTGNIAAFSGTNTGTTAISGTITVTPVSGTCTGTQITFSITVNPVPTITTPQNQTICAGQQTTAITFSGTSGATYTWSNDNTTTGLGASGNGNIAAFTGTNTSNASITSNITVTPTLGTCPGTPVTFSITVAVTPTISTVTSQTICAGQQTTAFTFSGTATTYNWSNSNTAIGLGASGTGDIAAFTGTNSGTTAISGTITVTPVSGTCTGTPITFSITVNPVPTITTPQNQTICAGQQTTAITFSGTSGATYTWSNDNTTTGLGASGNGNIAAFTGTNTSNASITSNITVTPTLGTCPGTPVTFTITIAVTPTISTVTSQTICAGQQTTAITFSGTATTYNWSNSNTNIGLGASGTGNIAAFTGTNTGSSTISGTITVTPVSGTCTGTPVTFSITVNNQIIPTFTQLGPYCQNSTPGVLSTSSTNSPAIVGSWSPTIISTSAVGNQSHTFTPNTGQCATTTSMTIITSQVITPTFTQLGPYCQNTAQVTLPTSSTNSPVINGTWSSASVSTITVGTTTYTFTPAANQCAGSATMSIVINAQPTITVSSQTICAGQSATLNTTANPTGGTYLWSNNQTTSSITVTPNATATYSILYILNSCNTSSSATVTVNPIINPNFSALGPYCQNTVPGNFVNTSTNGISGSWNPSSITTSSPGNQIYTFTPTTGQCASTASMTIVITPLTTPTFNTIGPLCLNSTAPFLPLSSTNLTPINGTWNPSTISTSTIGTTSYTFSPNAGQCAVSSTINITIENAPIPSIQTTTTQGCAPLSVTLSSSNLPNTIYNWESNGVNIGTGATVNTVFTSAGCYDISLQLTANGCSSNSTYTDYICVENTPNASFTATPNSFTETNQDVYFGNNSSNAVSYNWYFGDGDSSSLFEPNHLYTNITNNMQVTLVAMSAFGCIDNYTLTIPFKDDLVYYVPNTFTPDGDEHNQAWGPVFTKGFDPYNFHLQIFNRWGELIWESNDANAKWDGTYGIDGKKVQQGTYTYKIKFQSKETDKKYTITGNINLLK